MKTIALRADFIPANCPKGLKKDANAVLGRKLLKYRLPRSVAASSTQARCEARNNHSIATTLTR
jgi:hypothetical protein